MPVEDLKAIDAFDLVAGTKVGDYVVEQKIGEGGMGIVYRGQQPVIGKRVAIKVLSAQLSFDRSVAQRFVQEARLVNQIGHPNIVDIFLFGQLQDGRHYFVMELLEGTSLQGYLESHGALRLSNALEIALPVCDALAAAHEAQVIHRDLKPANVFLKQRAGTQGFAVKLLDFGIAKLDSAEAQGLTRTGSPIGTPLYMAPEQFDAKNVDARADIYALGVMLFQMVTGRLPFEAKTFTALMVQKASEKPPRIRDHGRFPEALDGLVAECMAIRAEDRPASMLHVRARLLDIAQEDPSAHSGLLRIGGYTAEMAAMPRRPPRSRRAIWVALGVGGGAIVSGALALTLGGRHLAAPLPPVAATPLPPAPAPRLPAAPLPVTATLSVRTQAPKATFVVDGKPSGNGTGTLQLRDLPAGEHHVAAEAPGFQGKTETIRLGAGQALTLDWTLEKLPEPSPPKPPAAHRDEPRREHGSRHRTRGRDRATSPPPDDDKPDDDKPAEPKAPEPKPKPPDPFD